MPLVDSSLVAETQQCSRSCWYKCSLNHHLSPIFHGDEPSDYSIPSRFNSSILGHCSTIAFGCSKDSSTVPRELEEVALLDGCSRFEIFAKIILPLSPAIAVTALFSFLAAWNEFLLALTFNTSNDMYTLPVGLASMISSTGQSWGDFAAASLLVTTCRDSVYPIPEVPHRGISAGGVKG